MDGARHTTLRCSGVHRGTGGMNIHNPQTGESRASRDEIEKYQTQTETHQRTWHKMDRSDAKSRFLMAIFQHPDSPHSLDLHSMEVSLGARRVDVHVWRLRSAQARSVVLDQLRNAEVLFGWVRVR